MNLMNSNIYERISPLHYVCACVCVYVLKQARAFNVTVLQVVVRQIFSKEMVEWNTLVTKSIWMANHKENTKAFEYLNDVRALDP